jgi:hypothetical protein
MLKSKKECLMQSLTSPRQHRLFTPSHIIGNIFVRLQAEKQMAAFQSSCVSKQEATVSKLASSLPPYGNTIIPHEITEKHIRSWQAHLERVSDFMLTGKGSWWMDHENGDIEFYDVVQPPDNHAEGPHFITFDQVISKVKRNTLKNVGRNVYSWV